MLVFPAIALAQACITNGIHAIAPTLFTPHRTAGSLDSTTILSIPPTISTVPAPPTNMMDYFPTPVSPRNMQSAWGDSIHQDPSEYHRVYFQNIDGLQNTEDQMKLYASSMAQFHASTFCWADHGLNLAQTPVSQGLQRPIVANFGMARSAYSYSSLPPDRLHCEADINLEERSPALPRENGYRDAKENPYAIHQEWVDGQDYALTVNTEKKSRL